MKFTEFVGRVRRGLRMAFHENSLDGTRDTAEKILFLQVKLRSLLTNRNHLTPSGGISVNV